MVNICGRRIATVLVLSVVVFMPATSAVRKVFADGLFMETFPPVSIGNRDLSLFVRVNPPVLVSGTDQNAYLQLRLFDANTNNTIQWTTFYVTVTKGVASDAQAILQSKFTSESGLLTLHVTPNQGAVQYFGQYDDVYGYQADPGGNVKISGPLFLDGGLYHFHILLLGLDSPKGLLDPNSAPTFDAYLSVGDFTPKDINYKGQTYNTTLISYYDKASGFDLNSGTQTFSWSMPFDWNASRISAAPSFLVHEEVRIPKSMPGFGDASSFSATLNGQTLPPRLLLIDPYSYSDAVVIHYLLGKNDVVKYADQITDKTAMHFSLSPGNASAAAANQNETTGVWQGERTNVLVGWSPVQLSSATNSTVNLTFIDSQGTGKKIAGDVQYTLNVIDMNGTVVLTRPGLVAKNGNDIQYISFPNDGKYAIQARITSINLPNFPPDIRPDIATGIVVVPEFPAGSLLAAAGIIAALVLAQRVFRMRKSS